jgi:transcriptional regulator with XRE-family HTH domain
MNAPRAANEVDEHLGGRVRERRLALDMSQEQLADLLGVTFQQIQKYEKGLNRIAASRLWEMTSALDVDITYFFEGLNRPKPKRRR